MNNFIYDLKKEVSGVIPTNQDDAISELSGIIKASGEISKNGKNYNLVIKTDLIEICNLIQKLVQFVYGIDIEYSLINDKNFSKNKYLIQFPSENTLQILQDTEIIFFDEQKYLQINNEISPYLIAEESSAQSYLRGIFLGCFSSNINLSGEAFQNRSTGYHTEFVFQNQHFAQYFGLFLADFDIISKTIERNGNFVVYVKDFDMICDLLILCGANKGVLALQNENAMRSIRNDVNRQTNCISANLSKTVNASVKEMSAIDVIRDTIGLDSIEENLREACYLRIANPEESLENLSKLSTKPVSKSALFRRFQKIEKIANELRK